MTWAVLGLWAALACGSDESSQFFHGRKFATGEEPRGVVSDDFNGDGFLDLATANDDSRDVSVLLGTGDGNFLNELRFPVGATPFKIASGDFNDDGIPDLATVLVFSGDAFRAVIYGVFSLTDRF